MPDKFVEVLLEVPTTQLAHVDDPTHALYEMMRDEANRKCAEVGARVDAGVGPVEVLVQEARHPLLGDMTLVASRWAVAK